MYKQILKFSFTLILTILKYRKKKKKKNIYKDYHEINNLFYQVY